MSYCSQCGKNNDLSSGGQFCSGCGAPVQQAVKMPTKKEKSIKTVLLFSLVGLILLIFGFQQMALQVIGQSTTAQITRVRQNTQSDGSGRADPTRYSIQYAFSVNGTPYTGHATQRFPKGIRSEQTIRIRYLPMLPSVNSSDEKTSVLGGVFFLVLGLVVMVFGLTGKLRLTSRK